MLLLPAIVNIASTASVLSSEAVPVAAQLRRHRVRDCFAAQMNDVYVDENGLIYAIERFTGGLYVLEGTW